MIKSNARAIEILKRFAPRLNETPFTVDGIPSEDEVRLTRDIWAFLSSTEKAKICDNIRGEFRDRYGNATELPDPTPYAMRLTHRYLDLVNAEAKASAG